MRFVTNPRSALAIATVVLWSFGCGDAATGDEQGQAVTGDDGGVSVGKGDLNSSGDDAAASDDDIATGDDDVATLPDSPVAAIDAMSADQAVDDRIETTLGGLADTVQSIQQADDMGGAMTMDVMDGVTACGGVNPIDLNVQPAIADLDDAIRKLSDSLRNDVFREDLIESDDGTTVVYYMDPDNVCAADDLQCQQDLSETPVRFAVTNYEDGSLRIVAQIGDERNEPATMLLTEDSITVSADLGELLDVLKDVSDPDALDSLPDTLTGVIEGSIVKNADQNFSLNLSIVKALTLSQPVGDTGDSTDVSVAASPNALEVIIDGITNSVGISTDIEALDVSVPGSVLCTEDSSCGAKEKNGTFHVHLDGVSAATVLQDNATEISVSNVGLGNDTSYADLNDDPLVELDVNPDDGRRFSMKIEDQADGALVTFEPKLDIAMASTLLNLSAAMRADLPTWLEDEIFRVTLGGAARGQVKIPDSCADSSHLLEVTKGTLTLDATSIENPVEVAAGMCLVSVESESDHPFDQVAADVCQ